MEKIIQTAIFVHPDKMLTELNKYLDEGWLVKSVTVLRKTGKGAAHEALVVLEKTNKLITEHPVAASFIVDREVQDPANPPTHGDRDTYRKAVEATGFNYFGLDERG